ncbi:MAG: flagellar motor switch protein FliN [Myxococcales bacterium]|jgi:flagellar motor switch protein FliN/FliY|nr:flagellar motor switch protein FliN [Myxococcales bacterium]
MDNSPSISPEPAPTPSSPGAESPAALDRLRDVEVEVTVEIGRRRVRIADALRMGPGHTIELEKQAGEPLDVRVNGRLVARGEAVVVGDRYAIRIVELIGGERGER